jgi:hypothetical protein
MYFHWDIACILALSLSWIHDKGLIMEYGYLFSRVLGISSRGDSKNNMAVPPNRIVWGVLPCGCMQASYEC